MTKIAWQFLKKLAPNTDLTSYVLSLNYFQGRQHYLNQYAGGILNITLNNSTNIASNFVMNEEWQLYGDGLSGVQYFWVQGVTLNDYPGNTGLSTCTVQLGDVLARNGRNVVTNSTIPQLQTTSQVDYINTWNTPQQGNVLTPNLGNSTASAITYTGSVLNYWNFCFSTERGVIGLSSDSLLMNSRNSVAESVISFSFSRNSPSASVISYNEIERIKLNLNFYNQCTVISTGVADQTVSNAASVTSFGVNQLSVSTVDFSASQAAGNAGWVANSHSDPAAEYFRINVFDIPQDSTALQGLLAAYNGSQSTTKKVWDLVYRVPGAGSDTTVQVVIEGIGINATPERTDFDIYLSPLTLYQFFTLDSSVLGILGGGGNLYDQPEIEYDENGWIYNDANVEQGSRLGW
jgi:hypothetical protein